MVSSWQLLHERLIFATQRRSFHRRFEALPRKFVALAPFRDGASLLRHQTGDGPAPEAREGVIRALVAAISESEAGPEVAQTLLLLVLWPGLDAVRGRLRRYWQDGLPNLDAEVTGRLLVIAARTDLDRVNRLAATLLRNLERDIRRHLMQDAGRAACAVPIDPMGAEDIRLPPPLIVQESSIEARLDAHRFAARLDGVLGADAGLVRAVVLEGLSQVAAGAALGLSHEASRKRLQRAMARLRQLAPGTS